jgi:hypothetical protein
MDNAETEEDCFKLVLKKFIALLPTSSKEKRDASQAAA